MRVLLLEALESTINVPLVRLQTVVIEKVGDEEVATDAEIFVLLLEAGDRGDQPLAEVVHRRSERCQNHRDRPRPGPRRRPRT